MKIFTQLICCTLSLMASLQAMKSSEPQQALFKAAQEGNANGIKAAVVEGVDINGTFGQEKETALHIAADSGQEEAVEVLLGKGASIDQQDAQGRTALHRALGKFLGKEAHYKVAELLLEKGATSTLVDNDGNTILHVAITPSGRYFYDDLLTKLKGSVDLNAQNKAGKTALQKAVEANDSAIVQTLLKAKASPSLTDLHGNNALHSGLKNNALSEIINAILESDATLINKKNNAGQSPLHLFVETMNNNEIHAAQNPTEGAQDLLKKDQEVGALLARTHIDKDNLEKAIALAQGKVTKKTVQDLVKA